jgi:DNA helicase-2/ATP-dependent DNA helicase PcrA
MDHLNHSRRRARAERENLGGVSHTLLDRLRSLIEDTYQLELVPVNKEQFLRGSRAEVVLAEGCLYYDQALDDDRLGLLEVLAHELAHLVLHHRSFLASSGDLIRGSVFLASGTPALSRYGPRSREEAEASAFAAEFICPASEVFRQWDQNPSASAGDLAEAYHGSPALIRLQLAQGLFGHIAGDEGEEQNEETTPTPEQEAAATACGSPVLVDAGPGTGKTKTLIRRIIYLLKERMIAPERLLILTFSNEAAAEIQQRLRQSLEEDVASRVLALTFHGYGVVLLNTLGHHIGLSVDFSILDETSQQELISDLLADAGCEALLNIKDPEATALEAVNNINYLKDRLIAPEELRLSIEHWHPRPEEHAAYGRAEALLRLFEAYERVKRDRQQVDFADLILLPYRLLASTPELKQGIRKEFEWVMVDEYQDVSRATAMFLQQICGPENPPWVVGDARQAIYRFRGAEPENVRGFGRDFPGAQDFHLTDNYRSAPEIISLLNNLAAWLDNPEHEGAAPARWRPGKQIIPVGIPAVMLGAAKSDAAERAGIVAKVRDWLTHGLRPEDVAVLARRNIDVRNLAVDLKRGGIRAVTSGLLTAEGAGGDLAAVITTVDHLPALPRLVYALGRDRFSPPVLNDAIRQLLSVDQQTENEPSWTGPDDARHFIAEVWTFIRSLKEMVHSADGWVVMCDFLFFATSYLRQLLSNSSDAVSAVQLEEVLSSLSLAATYRFGHSHVRPRRSRLGLAEKMRDLVTEAAPGLVPPGSRVGAVRVMTCHASKGLEFPCAAVAGQSLSEVRPSRPCLPPSLRASRDNDLEQAESLLFVGISRAQRSAVVSYATSASGTSRSKLRRFPRLLTRLQESGLLPFSQWNDDIAPSSDVSMGRVWGGSLPTYVSLYSLSSNSCQLRTYLEEQLGARFTGRHKHLYPEFISRVRRMLRKVVDHTFELSRGLTDAEAHEIFEVEWPSDKYQDHPHILLYRPRAERWTKALADVLTDKAFRKGSAREETLEWQDSTGTSGAVRLQLIGHFEDSDGAHVAVGLQVSAPDDTKESINWSALKDYERLPFVLLQEMDGDLQPLVFCGEEGELRQFRWNRQRPSEAISREASAARETFAALASGNFQAAPNDWICDHCSCRVVCPWWMGASG